MIFFTLNSGVYKEWRNKPAIQVMIIVFDVDDPISPRTSLPIFVPQKF